MTSYAYEAKVGGRFYANAVRFATAKEAEQAATDKLMAWSQCEDTRVVEHEDPVNYRYDWDQGVIIHVATELSTK